MELSVINFTIYLVVAGNTTYFIGRTLHRNGEHFLISIFITKPEVVRPINNILLVGFYLINIGFVLLFFSQDIQLSDWISCLEFLSIKIGSVYLVLGSIHMFNILIFMTIENKFNINTNK